MTETPNGKGEQRKTKGSKDRKYTPHKMCLVPNSRFLIPDRLHFDPKTGLAAGLPELPSGPAE